MKSFLTSRLGILLAIFTFAAMAKLSGHTDLLWAPMVFGTVAGAAGSPDYTYSTGTGNIPVKFANKSLLKFYDASILPNISNKDYAGEIAKEGDEVVIPTVPTITVRKHTKNSEHDWDIPKSDPVKMTVNRSTIFAFRMDKIDLRQFQNKRFMNDCATDAGEQQKIYIDTEFLGEIYSDVGSSTQGATAGKSGFYNLGVSGTPLALTKGNVLDTFVDCGCVLDEMKVPKSDRWFVIPPWVTGMLKKSDLKDASMTGQTSALMSGRLGMFDNWELFDSNLYTPITDGSDICYPLIFGHKRAICFASDIVDNAYFDKFERYVGQGMRGVQVYDWKLLNGDWMGVLYVKRSA